MENSYFIYNISEEQVVIERFHICTWEFPNDTSFIEFGFEIDSVSINGKDSLELELYIPWLTGGWATEDLYPRLREPQNSRFIFNDSINGSTYLDGGTGQSGVIYEFSGREKLCLLPVTLTISANTKSLIASIDLRRYNSFNHSGNSYPNGYIRFALKPSSLISTRKRGITKATVLYDIRVNQKRNIPTELVDKILHDGTCEIRTCFCFNIIPNNYDLVFLDSSTLKNVRTLEHAEFAIYLNDNRIKKDNFLVVFNKKTGLDSYIFFSIYSKEFIGPDQLAIAILINLVSGVLLFIPSYRIGLGKDVAAQDLLAQMPLLFWTVVAIIVLMFIYLLSKRGKK